MRRPPWERAQPGIILLSLASWLMVVGDLSDQPGRAEDPNGLAHARPCDDPEGNRCGHSGCYSFPSTGFTFVGWQVHCGVGGDALYIDFYIDLLCQRVSDAIWLPVRKLALIELIN